MSTKLPNEQARIDQAIVDEIFAILPEEWTGFSVTIEPRTGLDGGGQIVTMVDPDRAGAAVEPSDDLRTAIGALVAWLAARNAQGALAFAEPQQIRAAVDGVMMGPDAPLSGAKEVALFPPVTGG